MELWQFSLFFVALLLGYVMLHVRVARFETYLHELQRLASLDARLQAIGASMPALDKQRLDRIESLLQRLHEDLEDLRETTQHVEEAVVQIPSAPPARERVAEAEAARNVGGAAEVGLGQVVERGHRGVLGAGDSRGGELGVERVARDGRALQHAACIGAEAMQLFVERGGDRARHGD